MVVAGEGGAARRYCDIILNVKVRVFHNETGEIGRCRKIYPRQPAPSPAPAAASTRRNILFYDPSHYFTPTRQAILPYNLVIPIIAYAGAPAGTKDGVAGKERIRNEINFSAQTGYTCLPTYLRYYTVSQVAFVF